LRETVGYFSQDPKLFLVQTPHIFLNPDPIERNLRTFERMPSENEMFYGVTQCGLDKWNGSFFCGSAALLRRAALMSGGGFSGITITEDCETALERAVRFWERKHDRRPTSAPNDARIEQALLEHGVILFAKPTPGARLAK